MMSVDFGWYDNMLSGVHKLLEGFNESVTPG